MEAHCHNELENKERERERGVRLKNTEKGGALMLENRGKEN